MAETNLIPGFRFHPTDVELVKYYLRRKVMGQRFPVDVIAELDIYKYAPWDLPDKSLLRVGDLKWYFFCPREKKYSTGGRMNRATQDGFWKTTGKDRSIEHKNQVVGMIKTLVFHRGRPPKGDRTDWVMHEFRLEDKELTNKGIPQDSYVICRVFQKEGPGPRNGAQYGKPFNEEDWDKEEIPASVPAMSVLVPIQPSTSHISVANDMDPSTSECIGLISVSCLSGLVPSCPTHPSTPSNRVDDDIISMLDTLKENDNTLGLNDNIGIEVPDNPGQTNYAEAAPSLNQSEIFEDLVDLDSLVGCGEEGLSFSDGLKDDEYTTNQMLSTGDDLGLYEAQDFLELADLEAPLFWQTNQQGGWNQNECG